MELSEFDIWYMTLISSKVWVVFVVMFNFTNKQSSIIVENSSLNDRVWRLYTNGFSTITYTKIRVYLILSDRVKLK